MPSLSLLWDVNGNAVFVYRTWTKKIRKSWKQWSERLWARWTLCRRSWAAVIEFPRRMLTDFVAACVDCLRRGTLSTGSRNGRAKGVPSAAYGSSSGEWIRWCRKRLWRLESRNRAYRSCCRVSWLSGLIRTTSATDSGKTAALAFYSTAAKRQNQSHLARGTFSTVAEMNCWNLPICSTPCRQLLQYRRCPCQCQALISSSIVLQMSCVL